MVGIEAEKLKVDLYTFGDVPVYNHDLEVALELVRRDHLPFTMSTLPLNSTTNLWELPNNLRLEEWMQIIVDPNGITHVVQYTLNRSVAKSVTRLESGGSALISGFDEKGKEKLAHAVYQRYDNNLVFLPAQFPGTIRPSRSFYMQDVPRINSI